MKMRVLLAVTTAFASPVLAQEHHHMPGMDMPATATTTDPAQQDKTPPTSLSGHEGHDVGAMTPAPASPEASGTDLPAGNAAAPPIQANRLADRYFDAGQMAHAQAMMIGEHGGMTYHQIILNLAERQIRNGRDGWRWDGMGWFGGDIDRFVVASEGEAAHGRGIEHGEVQALWSHAVDPYWNLQAGVRQDIQRGPDRSYATIGIEGLAPYWFDVEARLFLSNKGDLLGRIEGHYDQRITQRLVLQPRIELNFAAQDVPESGIGSGLSTAEAGLRLRYEFAREFAPYLGISWERSMGDSASFARLAGEDVESTSLVLGVRFWF